MSTRPPPPHAPGCRCSSCHLSSKLFPRGPNDRIILPAIRPGDPHPQGPYVGGNDRAHFAPPRPQSTAPHEYRPRHHDAPPMPMSPRYGAPPSGGSGTGSRRSFDQHAAPPPPPGHGHGHEQGHRHGHGHHRSMSAYAPPERPASAMATRSPAMSPAPSHARAPNPSHSTPQGPPPDANNNNGQGQGNLEWMPPRLKWVKKKERDVYEQERVAAACGVNVASPFMEVRLARDGDLLPLARVPTAFNAARLKVESCLCHSVCLPHVLPPPVSVERSLQQPASCQTTSPTLPAIVSALAIDNFAGSWTALGGRSFYLFELGYDNRSYAATMYLFTDALYMALGMPFIPYLVPESRLQTTSWFRSVIQFDVSFRLASKTHHAEVSRTYPTPNRVLKVPFRKSILHFVSFAVQPHIELFSRDE
ncbi:hypothetical protein C8F04DRAFT_1227576 [Mycena alexandri]|uniref:Uncharacterized protein n=1 Tax=Mycena alexandri TaxID=1745969 RepID=A0AAD6THR7_9AGAR|nr:hypothetical protein C8F04DRAFT_1227576 [Mycena alexandri]